MKRSQIITSMHFIKQSNWMEELCLEGLYCGLPSVRAEGRFCVLTIRNDVTAAQALAHVHNYCSFLFVDATSSYGAFSLEFLTPFIQSIYRVSFSRLNYIFSLISKQHSNIE